MNRPKRLTPARLYDLAPAARPLEVSQRPTLARIVRWAIGCRWIAVAVAVGIITGCQSSPAPFDPFLAGRTTIPPPATAVQVGTAPYYNGGAPSVTVPVTPETMYTPPGATSGTTPGLTVPPASSGALPRGMTVPQSNNLTVSKDVQLAAAAAPSGYFNPTKLLDPSNAVAASTVAPAPAAAPATDSGPATTSVLASASGSASAKDAKSNAQSKPSSGVVAASFEQPVGESSIHIVEPLAKAKPAPREGQLPVATTSSTPLAMSPRTSSASNAAANSMSTSSTGASLAIANALAPKSAAANSSVANSSVAKSDASATARSLPELTDFPKSVDRKASGASANSSLNHSLSTPSAIPGPADSASRPAVNYAHDARYGWLQGKLEYSPSQKRWKLRYIAVEDASDDYGGSVILSDSDKLKSFQPGDFVTIHGRVLAAAEKSKGFSPTYGIERIVRQ